MHYIKNTYVTQVFSLFFIIIFCFVMFHIQKKSIIQLEVSRKFIFMSRFSLPYTLVTEFDRID